MLAGKPTYAAEEFTSDALWLRRRTALLDRLLQHLPELRCVLMAMNLHRMLHGNFDEFLFTVGGYCDRAFALRRHFPAIDIFPGHDFLLGFENHKSLGAQR